MQNGVGDVNDLWRVEIIGGSEGEAVKTVVNKLRLVHVHVGCALQATGKQLPKW